MIDNAATIAKMKDAGLSAETILVALGCIVLCAPAVERSGAARRQAAYRERIRAGHNTLCDVDNSVMPSPIPPRDITNQSQEGLTPPTPSKPKRNRRDEAGIDGWDAFKAAYPRRDGHSEWTKAAQAFVKAVQRAGSPLPLIAAAKAYAAHCRSKERENTQYVKMPRGWLNDDIWREWVPKVIERGDTVSKPVFVDTPEWSDLCKSLGKEPPQIDIRDPSTGRIRRGFYAKEIVN